ncbi:cohesin domain-containing protein [uncultured Methanolobus sp.]|uniref:cohesin domain-containing protein n=1 Tax=uncultured Methanolobus sp. TaxID=218300 RepID=UPI002AAB66A1|nr:cohesin domain-containing protein [uncultured Methanolobus sp.]
MTNEKRKGLVVSATSLLIFFACFMVGIGLAAASPSLSVDPSLTDNLSQSDTFAVEVIVDSEGASLDAVEFNLVYDTSALSMTGSSYSGLMGTQNSDVFVIENMTDDGNIFFSVADATPAAQAGNILTVNFKVKAGAADALYDLDLSGVSLVSGTSTLTGVSVNDGEAKVGDGDIVVEEDPFVQVVADSGSFSEGESFQATVVIDSKSNSVSAVEFDLAYDNSIFSLTGASYSGLMGAQDSDAFVIEDMTDDGSIYFSVADSTPAMQSGVLVTLDFEVNAGAADGSYLLDIQDATMVDGSTTIPGVDEIDDTVEVTNVPNTVPIANITSHTSGETVSQVEIISVVDDSGDDDVVSATFEIFADLDGDCNADDVGEDWSVLGEDTDGTDGWSVVFDTTTVPDGSYLIKATIDDGQDTSFEIICVTVYNPEGILLKPGWNFISVPEALETPDVNDVLTDFDSTVIDAVFYDDLSSGVNTMVIPTEFEPLKGYWIHNALEEDVVIVETYLQKSTTVPATPATVRLYPGWNAIGHTALEAQSADIALVAIGDSCIKIKGPWVPSANDYAFVGLNIVDGSELTGNFVTTADFQLDAYEGFYVLVQEECLLG